MLQFFDKSWEQYLYFKEKNIKVSKKIDNLIKDTLRNPFSGIGKPEPLKNNLTGYWSKRITDEHRLVYKYENNVLMIFSCKYHYAK